MCDVVDLECYALYQPLMHADEDLQLQRVLDKLLLYTHLLHLACVCVSFRVVSSLPVVLPLALVQTSVDPFACHPSSMEYLATNPPMVRFRRICDVCLYVESMLCLMCVIIVSESLGVVMLFQLLLITGKFHLVVSAYSLHEYCIRVLFQLLMLCVPTLSRHSEQQWPGACGHWRG